MKLNTNQSSPLLILVQQTALEEAGEWTIKKNRNDKTERARGLGRKTREETGTENQNKCPVAARRFQTEGWILRRPHPPFGWKRTCRWVMFSNRSVQRWPCQQQSFVQLPHAMQGGTVGKELTKLLNLTTSLPCYLKKTLKSATF